MTELAELTAFQIWLRPGKTRTLIRQALESSSLKEREFADKLNETAGMIAGIKNEKSRLQAENTELSLKYKKLKEEYQELNNQIAEVQAMFVKVQELKERYDRRIERFKAQIADLKTALTRKEDAEAADEITPLPPLPKSKQSAIQHKQTPPPPEKAEADTASDWYLPLDL
ncbi:MAG: hypothetical protein NC402_01405 [Prevotella sp.]|nr:hypothetical protein [Prevotella sp.]MCM1074520.1 hypothetical protein [Ruminococcus sp.]